MARNRSFLVVVMGHLVWLALGCTSQVSDRERTAPEEIRGAWTTLDPAYAGRAFEILDDALIFHTGEGTFDVYVINALREAEGSEGVEFQIDHRGREGGLYTLSFTFRSSDNTIVFRNQPSIIWIRGPS